MKKFFDGLAWIFLGLSIGVYAGLEYGDEIRQRIPDGGFEVIDAKYPNAWVLVVWESADKSSVDFKKLQASDYFTSLKDRQLQYRLFDKDDPALPAAAKQDAAKVGFPALMILNEGGDKLLHLSHPQHWTRTAIDEIVTETTGQ